MRVRGLVWKCLALIALGTMPAAAQDAGKVGITMGYPASIGLLWKVSDKVAVRPELAFAGSSNESSSEFFETDSDGWAISTGVSALFYLKKYESLQTYFAPRFTYSHTSTESSTSAPLTTPQLSSSNKAYGFAGSFGGEYALGDKFAVFGEVGFGFSHNTAKSSLSTGKSSGNSWGTRAGVGIVFFP